MIGSVYDSAGNVVRSAAVTLEGADESTLRSLARFLAGDAVEDGVSVVTGTPLFAGIPLSVAGARSGQSSAPAISWVGGLG